MKKNIIYKLLYRATRDGNDAQIFYKKCDNIMETLAIIKTTKGMRFGGYTEKKWIISSPTTTFYKDYKGICFCFSLDLFRIYDFNGNSRRSIGCYYGSGPYFLDDNMVFLKYIIVIIYYLGIHHILRKALLLENLLKIMKLIMD